LQYYLKILSNINFVGLYLDGISVQIVTGIESTVLKPFFKGKTYLKVKIELERLFK
jgi:hypothetical protein